MRRISGPLCQNLAAHHVVAEGNSRLTVCIVSWKPIIDDIYVTLILNQPMQDTSSSTAGPETFDFVNVHFDNHNNNVPDSTDIPAFGDYHFCSGCSLKAS